LGLPKTERETRRKNRLKRKSRCKRACEVATECPVSTGGDGVPAKMTETLHRPGLLLEEKQQRRTDSRKIRKTRRKKKKKKPAAGRRRKEGGLEKGGLRRSKKDSLARGDMDPIKSEAACMTQKKKTPRRKPKAAKGGRLIEIKKTPNSPTKKNERQEITSNGGDLPSLDGEKKVCENYYQKKSAKKKKKCITGKNPRACSISVQKKIKKKKRMTCAQSTKEEAAEKDPQKRGRSFSTEIAAKKGKDRKTGAYGAPTRRSKREKQSPQKHPSQRLVSHKGGEREDIEKEKTFRGAQGENCKRSVGGRRQ